MADRGDRIEVVRQGEMEDACVRAVKTNERSVPPHFRKAAANLRLGAVVTSVALLAASGRALSVEPVEGCFGTSGTSEGGRGSMETMQITRAGTQASQRGPAQSFSGEVRIDMLSGGKEPSRTSAAYVTFEPCSRTAWHTHPLGQLLVVTSGVGRVQEWGGPLHEIRAGDVVWTPPGVKHWHGAAPATAMTHLAITEALNGKAVDWLEKVSDAEYGAGPAPGPQATRSASGLAAYGDRVVLGGDGPHGGARAGGGRRAIGGARGATAHFCDEPPRDAAEARPRVRRDRRRDRARRRRCRPHQGPDEGRGR